MLMGNKETKHNTVHDGSKQAILSNNITNYSISVRIFIRGNNYSEYAVTYHISLFSDFGHLNS